MDFDDNRSCCWDSFSQFHYLFRCCCSLVSYKWFARSSSYLALGNSAISHNPLPERGQQLSGVARPRLCRGGVKPSDRRSGRCARAVLARVRAHHHQDETRSFGQLAGGEADIRGASQVPWHAKVRLHVVGFFLFTRVACSLPACFR